MSRFRNSVKIAALTALFLTAPLASRAAPADYRFELAGQPEKTSTAMLVKVRLVSVAGEKPVSGVEIVEARLDMGPDGMAAMTAKVKALPSSEPDVYLFEAQPTMAGNWGLTLSAKAPGEPEAITGTVTIAVAK
ncbi:MAG: FixH family protein [Pseudomonadota bacterium]